MKDGRNNKNEIIRRIGRESMTDLEELYVKVYDRKPVKDHYSSKFATSYTGIEYAGWITYAGDRPVASLCLVPCFISYGGKRILVAQLTDGMTDPMYRRSGLFNQLEGVVKEFAVRSGISFLFGFPNQHAYPILLKRGWEEMEKLDRFVIPVPRTLWWFVSRIFNHVNRRGTKNDKQNVPAHEIHCPNSVLSEGFAGMERSTGYFLYKSFAPTTLIEAGEARAWIKTGIDLFIGDMKVSSQNFDEMIRRIQRVAKQSGAGAIHFQCSKDIGLHRLFSVCYQPIVSFPVLCKKLDNNIDAGEIRFTLADIDVF